ncbi:MAG: hypothetical protein ABI790_12465, partial [Betaproteobacteria bacterium]
MPRRAVPATRMLGVAVLATLPAFAFAQSAGDTAAPPAGQGQATPVIERERAASQPLKYDLPPIDPRQVEPPTPMVPRQSVSVPDRWRIMDTLGFKFPWYDPYNHNVYKGDKPYEPFAKWGPD